MALRENEQDANYQRIESFAQVFREHWQPLVQHAQKKLGNTEAAQDIIQETFVVLWNSEMLSRPQEIKMYLYGVVRHKILDEFRKNEVRLRYANERSNLVEHHYTSPDQILLTQELKNIIENEILEMPDRMREIFHMKKHSGLSIAEIAKALGLSEQTVKNQLYRGTNRLKERLVLYDSSLVVFGLLLCGVIAYLKD